MATVICPKCGTTNPDNAMNCQQCRINLKFALENLDEIGRQKRREQGLPEMPEQASNVIQSEKSRITCQNCRTETEAGGTYMFYYGTAVGQSKSYSKDVYSTATTVTTTTTYNISGVIQGYICDRCIATSVSKAHRRMGSALLFLDLFFVFIVFASYMADEFGIVTFICLLLGILCLVGAIVAFRSWLRISKQLKSNDGESLKKVAKSNLETGDVLISQLMIPDLQKKGFTNFWTRTAYKTLKEK